MKRYWTRSDFETDGISRDYPMKVGEVEVVRWFTHGNPVPEGAEKRGHGHHSALVKLPPSYVKGGKSRPLVGKSRVTAA